MFLINILGLLLIGLIVWWFWLYTPPAVLLEDGAITVLVDNGTYEPSRIEIPGNHDATLRFLRRDASPCASMVVFPDLDISEELPLNRPKDVRLPVMPAGEYSFTCQMQMYRGSLSVSDDESPGA